MPIYEYRCLKCGRVIERLRRAGERDDFLMCGVVNCLGQMVRVISTPHAMPDGMYSYAPNVGDPVAFEKRLIAQKEGKKTFDRNAD